MDMVAEAKLGIGEIITAVGLIGAFFVVVIYSTYAVYANDSIPVKRESVEPDELVEELVDHITRADNTELLRIYNLVFEAQVTIGDLVSESSSEEISKE